MHVNSCVPVMQSAQQDPGKNEDASTWVDIEPLIRGVPARKHVSLLSYLVYLKG